MTYATDKPRHVTTTLGAATRASPTRYIRCLVTNFFFFFSHVVTHRVTPATTSRRKFNGSQQVRTAPKTHRCGSRYPIFLCACLVSQLSEKGSGRIGYRCYVSTTMLRAAERQQKKKKKTSGADPASGIYNKHQQPVCVDRGTQRSRS